MTAGFLPYGRQEISEGDIEAVVGALRSPMITQGPKITEFEQTFAAEVGARHAVAFANGTAALHGAVSAAGLGPGDELITSPLSFAASANCALFVGAEPRFADIDLATYNLDPELVLQQTSDRTRAVVGVSFAGLPIALEPLRELRDRMVIIEDAAHALAAHRDGTPVGGGGAADMTTFSLHPVKAMTTGEGGMVTTDDDELADRLAAFRTHGIVRNESRPINTGGWHYDITQLGFNYRITDFQSALGLSQLPRVEGWVRRRNEIAERYRELLADEGRVALPPAAPAGSRHGYHLFVIRILAGETARLAVFEGLRSAGIGVQVHYIPIYRFTHYRDTLGFAQNECPNTETYYAGAISLPMFPGMTDDDVVRVVHELTRLLP